MNTAVRITKATLLKMTFAELRDVCAKNAIDTAFLDEIAEEEYCPCCHRIAADHIFDTLKAPPKRSVERG